MKVLVLSILVTILLCASHRSMATDTNNSPLNTYETLTANILKNFQQDADNLVAIHTSDRTLKTKLWLQLLNQIDRTRDLTFDFNSPDNVVYANIAVPFDPSISNSFIYPSGIAPSAIKEHEIRRKYEEALLKNRGKYLRAQFELQLQRLDGNCTVSAVQYFKTAFAKTVNDSKELMECLDAIDDATHKQEMLKQLADFIKIKN